MFTFKRQAINLMPLAGILFISLALAACDKPAQPDTTNVSDSATVNDVNESNDTVEDTQEDAIKDNSSSAQLAAVLASLDEEHRARHQYRNPQETLEFIGIEPGMKVGEVLPGSRGWYTKVLLPYLGNEGTLVGIDYPVDLWSNFSFMTPESLEAKKTWVADWTASTKEASGENSPEIGAYQINSMPDSMINTLDAVVFFRALHHLARFREKTDYLEIALAETYQSLKPGGIVGIVQHMAREDRPDAWANGDNGYMKKSFILERMQAAGFEFVGESDINTNPKDQAGEGDRVWRLIPASRHDFEEGSPEAEAIKAIGESHRMTLKFRKPA